MTRDAKRNRFPAQTEGKAHWNRFSAWKEGKADEDRFPSWKEGWREAPGWSSPERSPTSAPPSRPPSLRERVPPRLADRVDPNPVRLAAILGAAILIAGCLGPGTTAPIRYYVLDPIDRTGAPIADPERRMGVMPVQLPGYLDRPDLVERRGAEILRDRSSAWAAPLDEEFARVLAENLQRTKPSYDVAVFPWRRGFTPDHRLQVDVVRFEIEDGAAVLHARWRLLGGNGDGARGEPHGVGRGANPLAGEAAESRIRVPVNGAGEEARVQALSAALGRMSTEIAGALGP